MKTMDRFRCSMRFRKVQTARFSTTVWKGTIENYKEENGVICNKAFALKEIDISMLQEVGFHLYFLYNGYVWVKFSRADLSNLFLIAMITGGAANRNHVWSWFYTLQSGKYSWTFKTPCVWKILHRHEIPQGRRFGKKARNIWTDFLAPYL